MNKFLIRCLILALAISTANAQVWQKKFEDEIVKLIRSVDGGYTMITNNKCIRINDLGDTLWTTATSYGNMDILQLPDKNYLLLSEKGGIELNLLDAFGKTQWSRLIDSSYRNGIVAYTYFSNKMKLTKDGGLLIHGLSQLTYPNNAFQFDVITSLDNNFQKKWIVTEPVPYYGFYSDFVEVGDGFIFSGKGILKKYNYNGDSLWTKSYKNRSTGLIFPASDQGYIVTGNYFMKINAEGDTLFTTPMKGYLDGWDYSPDGGYFFAGQKDSLIYLSKTDHDGKLLWSQQFVDWKANSVIAIDENTILAGCKTYAYNGLDGLVMKVAVSLTNTYPDKSSPVYISFQNPCHDCIITVNGNIENLRLALFSAQGQKVRDLSSRSNEFFLQKNDLATGVYQLKIISFDKVIGSSKVIIE